MTPPTGSTVLHVCPHPDDELIAAPATLMAMRDAGHTVVNFAVGLGRPEHRDRREAELREASRRAGFGLRIAEPALAISRGDDLVRAERILVGMLGDVLAEMRPAVIVSPSPHDSHHGHEVVGRAVREALRGHLSPPPWWLWGLWADLPHPTLLVPYDDARLAEIAEALGAYEVELGRNDYRRLVEGRGMETAVLGPERVFGFGAPSRGYRYAEVLTEVIRARGGWWLGRPRELDPSAPAGGEGSRRADAWIDAPSPSERLRDPSHGPAPPG